MGICWEPHCLTWIYRRAGQPGVRQPELADIGARLTAVDDSLGGQAEAVRGVLARWPLPPVYPGAVDLLALAGRSDRNVEPAVRLGSW